MQQDSGKWRLPALLGAGILAVFVFFWIQLNRPLPVPAEAIEQAPPAAEPVDKIVEQPVYPLPAVEDPAPAEKPLPTLEQSDAEITAAIVKLFGHQDLAKHLAIDGIIARTVATTDNLTRPRIAERLRPVVGVGGQFKTNAAWGADEDAAEFVLDPANYDRYDWIVNQLATMNNAEFAALYQHYYPLFQQAYVELGYPDDYFNDRLIAVIDHLLATPQVSDPVKLVRPHVLYRFADPHLEALSSGQKILIRMGSRHALVVKTKLRELRDILAG